MPGTSTTVAFPLNVAVRPVTLRLPLVTGPSTVITFKPLKPPVSGPAMLHSKIPPSAVTAKPKSDGESIVLPRRGAQIIPPPTNCAHDAAPPRSTPPRPPPTTPAAREAGGHAEVRQASDGILRHERAEVGPGNCQDDALGFTGRQPGRPDVAGNPESRPFDPAHRAQVRKEVHGEHEGARRNPPEGPDQLLIVENLLRPPPPHTENRLGGARRSVVEVEEVASAVHRARLGVEEPRAGHHEPVIHAPDRLPLVHDDERIPPFPLISGT